MLEDIVGFWCCDWIPCFENVVCVLDVVLIVCDYWTCINSLQNVRVRFRRMINNIVCCVVVDGLGLMYVVKNMLLCWWIKVWVISQIVNSGSVGN